MDCCTNMKRFKIIIVVKKSAKWTDLGEAVHILPFA